MSSEAVMTSPFKAHITGIQLCRYYQRLHIHIIPPVTVESTLGTKPHANMSNAAMSDAV